jgi:hypothetical protein
MNSGIVNNGDTLAVLFRLFLPSLAFTVLLIAVWVLYRWKVSADKRELQDLSVERLKLKMEALAAEKKAQRKKEDRLKMSQDATYPGQMPDDPDRDESEPIDGFRIES